jgi:hypothetical protein
MCENQEVKRINAVNSTEFNDLGRTYNARACEETCPIQPEGLSGTDNKEGCVRVVIYWKTRDEAKLKRIMEKFRFYTMTVNRLSVGSLTEEEMQLLEEVERLGYVEIRIKKRITT